MPSPNDVSPNEPDSSGTEERRREVLLGAFLLASSLALWTIYAEHQLAHTLRFLVEVIVDWDRIVRAFWGG